ncbi:MAG: PEP-CTERM sorting domain-containing protein, partial [Pirellulales bacterium]|nr:PEP-CTERM sorting domain-containing protein [Pirellulales bacterium]
PGEPNNYNNNEHYLQYFYDPTDNQEPSWNDIPMYDGVLSYVVEYNVPEPSTLVLLALGGLTLLWRRRTR